MDPEYPILDARQLLGRYGLHAKKSWGQNFLIDERAYEAIVAACDLSGSDLAVEVGAGLGTLTSRLLRTGASVIAIERDQAVMPLPLVPGPGAVLQYQGQAGFQRGDQAVGQRQFTPGQRQPAHQLIDQCRAQCIVQRIAVRRVLDPQRHRMVCQARAKGQRGQPGRFGMQPLRAPGQCQRELTASGPASRQGKADQPGAAHPASAIVPAGERRQPPARAIIQPQRQFDRRRRRVGIGVPFGRHGPAIIQDHRQCHFLSDQRGIERRGQAHGNRQIRQIAGRGGKDRLRAALAQIDGAVIPLDRHRQQIDRQEQHILRQTEGQPGRSTRLRHQHRARRARSGRGQRAFGRGHQGARHPGPARRIAQ